MLIIQRQDRLLELLRQRGSAQLDELAEAVGVSASTVRRDLEAIEQRGLIERTHGGAVYTGEPADTPRSPSVALAARMNENVVAKQAIGAVAAALVQPNMTVMLDGGSTVVYAARQITARPIRVVTNSLTIAELFKDDDDAELLLTGGTLYPRTEVTTGAIATGTLAELHADLLLTSMAGLDEQSVYNINLAMARVEQVMMQQASHTVLLMDASKFGRRSLTRVAAAAEFDRILTDGAVANGWIDHFGDRLVVCTPPQTAQDL